jgi:hypothetical protein
MPITPNQGSTGGGTAVTITGTNLSNATAVTFGTKPATITANTATSVSAISPSGTGVADVKVTTTGGTSNPLSFYYVGAPFKSTLSTVSGPTAGGNTVTITGTGLSSTTGVSFGGNAVTPTVVNDGTLTATVPAGAAAGPVGVTVTTAGGSSNGLTYTYVDGPTVTTVVPDSGPEDGGTAVTITGTNLSTTESVTFGGTAAPFSIVSGTTLSVVTPPGTAGPVDVVVTTTGGTATVIGGFTYVAGPGI